MRHITIILISFIFAYYYQVTGDNTKLQKDNKSFSNVTIEEHENMIYIVNHNSYDWIVLPGKDILFIDRYPNTETQRQQINSKKKNNVNNQRNSKPTAEKKDVNLLKTKIKQTENEIKETKQENDKNRTLANLLFICSDKYKNFEKEFNDKFKEVDDIWLVLGNDGQYNPYIERFSAINWLFWGSNPVPEKILSISGDYFNVHNWEYLSNYLPKKISYIAVDFNELICLKNKNEIINISSNILKKGGIFCIEDIFDIKKQKFSNFSEKDVNSLSKNFDIKYALYDGFVASLPYTSNMSKSYKNTLFKGIEKVLLKLSISTSEEKKAIGLNLSTSQLQQFKTLSEDMIRYIISDIIYDSTLGKNIVTYNALSEEIKKIEEEIGGLTTEIDSINKDIENFNKINQLKSSAMNKFNNLLDKGSSLIKKVKGLTQSKKSMKKISNISKESNVEQVFTTKLDEKNKKLLDKNQTLTMLKSKIIYLKTEMADLSKLILRQNNNLFNQFSFDKLLNRYMDYKRNNVDDIINDSKVIEESFNNVMKDKDSNDFLAKIEKLVDSIKNGWSPKLILNNSLPFEQLLQFTKHMVEPSARVLIVLVKK